MKNKKDIAYLNFDKEDERNEKSFYMCLAKHVIAQGGYVCGAIKDDFCGIKYVITESLDKIQKMQYLKYVYSDMSIVFEEIKELLDSNKIVLVYSYPCQIEELIEYLGKEYNNLITIDTICNGTIGQEYLKKYVNDSFERDSVEEIIFSDRRNINEGILTTVKFNNSTSNIYNSQASPLIRPYLQEDIYEEVCYSCKLSHNEHISDFTIAVYGDLKKNNLEYTDEKCRNILIFNSSKAIYIYKQLSTKYGLNEILSMGNSNIELEVCYGRNDRSNFRKQLKSNLKTMNYIDAYEETFYGRHYNIGIVGWWYYYNYGSILTYYALNKVFEEKGYSVLMIQHSSNAARPFALEGMFSESFMKKYCSVSRFYKSEDMKLLNTRCDIFVSGSDQMWNPVCEKDAGPEFFLDFVDDSHKKISYASSLGNSVDASEEFKKKYRPLVERFSGISVREHCGIESCQKIYNKKPERVCDPVFLCNPLYYEKLINNSKLDIAEPYLLCFILDPNEEKIEVIKNVSCEKNLKVICLVDLTDAREKAQKLNMFETRPYAAVEDFLWLYSHADFIITDSFHGTCFSIIFNKDFLSIPNYGRGDKRVRELLSIFNLTNRIVEKSYTKLKTINYSDINEIIKAERSYGWEWLKMQMSDKESIDENLDNKKMLQNNNSERIIRMADQETQTNIEKLHKNPDFVKIRILATLLRDYGVKHIVLSPGGRDVPLVRMFENNADSFILHHVTDERSAAYFGLGIAAQLQKPVACICTSGTAASNYLPAVTEAFYTGVPLILVTADRREIYLNHGEDQTIPQKNIYSGVVKKEISIPEGAGYSAEYQTRRDISDCILETTHNGFGPVHINITIDNITIGQNLPQMAWRLSSFIHPHIQRVGVCDGELKMMKWMEELKKSNRILIVYGQNAIQTEKQKKNIEIFASKFNCVIVSDLISNYSGLYCLSSYNMLQNISQQEFDNELSPDILISVGGKRLMNDPLTFKIRGGKKNIRHWSVVPDGKIKDFYFRLTSVLEMSQEYFFEWFANHSGDIHNNEVYYNKWKEKANKYSFPLAERFGVRYIQSNFIPSVPANSILHLGVGQSFIDTRKYPLDPTVDVFCNMGTNGIDGCTSTFMGQCSVVKDRLCFLLVGDLSFFYDMNSIWNKQLNKNIRILMVNNNGTGLLRGHNLKAISSVHNTSAKGWVEATGFRYISARTQEEFDEKLKYFISYDTEEPLFFEVFCE